MALIKLSETVYLGKSAQVDTESGVLRNVKLLGEKSRNNRKYTQRAMQDAVPKYEGKKIYIDHPPDSTGDRSMDRWAGTVQNAHYESDGIYGDVKLRKKSGYFEGILEAAQEFPNDVGFSHVAEGESRMDKDTEIVESIREVFSVDLVTDPATTSGFFESKRTKVATIKETVEALPESEERKKLVEMMADFSFGDAAETDGQPTDPLGEISAMCRELIRMLGEALVVKNTPPPAPPPALAAEPVPSDKEADEQPEDDMTDEDKQKIEAFESLKRENAELQASKMLLESGREATAVRMRALASCATDDDRRELLDSWPKVEESGRPASSPALVESVEDFPRGNHEKFAALLR
jgi:hypothetical protein